MIDPGSVFLNSESVCLKALTEEDALSSNWYSWFNDAKSTRFMQQHYFPNTPELQLEFFRKDVHGARDKIQLGIVHRKDEKLVGVISLGRIDFLNRSAEIAWIIGEPEYRVLQVSFESIKLMIEHGFYSLNLRRIHGGSVDKGVNDLLCRMFNFRHEGTARQAVFLNGQYRDTYQFALLKSEYADFCPK